jgi:hypothetical protein
MSLCTLCCLPTCPVSVFYITHLTGVSSQLTLLDQVTLLISSIYLPTCLPSGTAPPTRTTWSSTGTCQGRVYTGGWVGQAHPSTDWLVQIERSPEPTAPCCCESKSGPWFLEPWEYRARAPHHLKQTRHASSCSSPQACHACERLHGFTRRRGYRDVMHKSPLNEAAAAGMLVLGGWPDICKQGGSLPS